MIRLHHAPQTRSMRNLWLLHELGVPFEVQVWPFDKSLRSDAFLALNPSGRVPALELDGRCVFETAAITQVLCEKFDALMGDDRVDWLVWLNFAETISQHAAALTQQHVALYDPAMRSPIITQLEPRRLGKCYDALEGRLRGRDYLAGSFSAADISCGQAVYMALHFAAIGERPALEDWYARITAREGFKASLPQKGETLLYGQDFYEALP